MSDPKNAPAGSATEPAASNPEAGLVPAPADYQFSSRKARRHAELTGMIPIVVPKNQRAEEQQQLSSAGKDDGDTGPGGSDPGGSDPGGSGPDTTAGPATAPGAKTDAGRQADAVNQRDGGKKKPDDTAAPAKVAANDAVSDADKKRDAAAAPAKVDANDAVSGHAATAPAAARSEKTGRKPRKKRANGTAPVTSDAAAAGPKDSSSKSALNANGTKAAGADAGPASAKAGAVAAATVAAPPQAAATRDTSPPRAAGTKESSARSGSKTAATKLKPADETATKAQPAVAAEAVSDVELSEQASAPRPVSAAHVTGIPVVPVPQGPIAAMPAAATIVKAPRTPKAGRDLPAAISVGLALLVLVLGSLLFYPAAFVAVATVFACVGVWEVNRAIAGKGISVPFTPVMVGALAMPASAYFAGAEGLLFALVASTGATVLWRSLDPEPGAAKSILAGVFSLMWIPFLLSFVFLMLRGEQGPTVGMTLDLNDINPGVVQVVIMLLLVVANDTFGYLVGALFGKHPMAPKISPKKSWEGFAGSLAGATLVAIPATVFLLDQHWWVGFALAIGMVFAGTGGDFAESMVKRELGVKDMSNLLPGHGGVMDRLDSILFAAPVAYAIFTLLGRF